MLLIVVTNFHGIASYSAAAAAHVPVELQSKSNALLYTHAQTDGVKRRRGRP
jgi:hypothetical protein